MAREEANFTIKYNGEALDQHSMDVKDLAPSLISFADFLEESFQIISGSDKQLRVKFRATTKGSLAVELQVVADIFANLATFFNSAQVSALVNFLEIAGILGIGGKGLVGAIKKLRGRRIKRVISRDIGAEVEIETDDGERFLVKREVPKLLESISIRENLNGFVKPLGQYGYDSIHFEDEKCQVTESIKKEESQYFDVPDIDEEELIDDTRKAAFSISSLSFKEGNKWRLSDGTNTYSVKIVDDTFLEKVSKNLATFAKDDVLIVKLRTRQLKTKAGLKTEYEIIEVLDHQSSKPQLKIPFEE